MKPAGFDYHRPTSLDEAARLMNGGLAKILAGGQSLGPMLNLRLAQPEAVVDVTAIAALKQVGEDNGDLSIGACVTHADIEDGRVPDVTRGLMPHVARAIAYRAVRNRGTIGGSLAHADPAGDWLTALPLVGARVVIWNGGERRTIAVEDLMTSSFTTVLEPDDVIEAILVPKLSSAARWGFHKFTRKAGEFAHAMAGVLHDPERGMFRAVIGAIDAAPIVVADAATILPGGFGSTPADGLDRDAVHALFDARGITDAYDRQLHFTVLRRAADQAGAS